MVLRSLPSLALAAVVPFLVACGDDPAEAGDPPAVEVADTGSGDKRLLEIDVEVGHRETTTLTVTQSIDAGTSPVDAPEVTITLETEVTGVDDDRVELTQAYRSIDVSGDDATAAQVESTLQPLIGLEGTIVLARSGAVIESDFEAPDDLDETVRSTFEQLEEQAGALSAAFPEEEIGVGAEWTAVSDLELSGIEVEQTTTYTLEELDGDDYRLSARIEQDFEPGEADGFEVVEGTGSTTGSFEGTVGLLFATQGQTEGESSVTVEAGGSEQTVTTTNTTSVRTTVE